MVKITRHPVEFSQGTTHLHKLSAGNSDKVILLIHGYFEDARIFFSKSGKGFAPYLAKNGFEVYAADLLGKGDSKPKVDDGFSNSQYQIITRDIPKFINTVKELSGASELSLGSHSWGGVLLCAYMARFNDSSIKKIVHFGAKRRIGLKNPRKWFMIDFMWDYMGTKWAHKYGFLPAQKMKMGNADEPKDYFLETNQWVMNKDWVSPVDQFNYKVELQKVTTPMLFITGAKDKILGHPKDVKRLVEEVGEANCEFQIIGKKQGFKNDYDHINLLTHPDGPKDHFRLVLDFLKH